MTKIYLNDFIFAISSALDFVESEIVGVTPHHSERIATISARLGKVFGFTGSDLLYLAASAALHDNALSEYRHLIEKYGVKLNQITLTKSLADHCTLGEENVKSLPFYDKIKGAVLYHHECADGSGPLGTLLCDTPVFARIIHIADNIDANFDLSFVDNEKYNAIKDYVNRNTGILFDEQTAGAFLDEHHDAQSTQLDTANLEQLRRTLIPDVTVEYTPEQIILMSEIFSKIIDYKSSFTCLHSAGIAEKSLKMGRHYGWDEDTNACLYLASSLHDIGKLAVPSEILEKPERLTEDEYNKIQQHVNISRDILMKIRGLDEVMSWAYLHHEKLDGSGYPCGKKADELGFKHRLLACLDIYQALVEPRPYKDGFTHSEAVSILKTLVGKGELDAGIVADIDKVFGKDTSNG